jgi:hypothetical protein
MYLHAKIVKSENYAVGIFFKGNPFGSVATFRAQMSPSEIVKKTRKKLSKILIGLQT